MIMKYYLFFILLISMPFITVLKVDAQQQLDSLKKLFPTTNTLEDKVYALSKIWSELNYNFVNIDQISFNLDSLYRSTLHKIVLTNNDIEFYDELQHFISSFNDGHTELLDRSYNWNDFMDYIPANIIEINKKYYFSKIRKKSSLDSTFLGAEILKIDSLSIEDYLRNILFPLISASTEKGKYFIASKKMQQGVKYSCFKGVARKLNGDISPFFLKRDGETTRRIDDQYWGPKQNVRNNDFSLDWESNIAILSITNFLSGNIKNKIDSVVKVINSNNTKGVIIDLRYNIGGNSDIANYLLKYLIKSEYYLSYGSQTRINNAYGRSQGNYRIEYSQFYNNVAYNTYPPERVKVDEYIKPINSPIILLIGKSTFSACEDLLVNLLEMPNRPLFFGEETAGTTGAPLLVSLPHNALVRIATLRLLFPYSKSLFVNRGIIPDIEICQSINDFINASDIVMEKAIDYINTLNERR